MGTTKALHPADPPHAGPLRQVVEDVLLAIASVPALLREVRRAFREIRARKRAAALDTRSREIDALYRELYQLTAQAPEGSEQAEAVFARLRKLQREEAAEWRERFEANLTLGTAEARAAIQEARRLLGRDEDPASANQTPVHQD
jgi:hypothetical protein